MLLNNFCTVEDMQAGEMNISCKISFNAAHEIFKGHFPGQPVVPGVCTMQIVRELLEQQTGKKLFMQNAANVKFLQLILPEVQPLATITWKMEDELLNTTVVFKADEKDAFKMNCKFSVVNS